MKEIELSNNKGVALVDDKDYDMLMKYKWCFCDSYAQTSITISPKNQKTYRMTHFINNISKDKETDHIDHNKLNNQKYNLRIVTRSQNMMNKSCHKNTTSEFKGVSWKTSNKKWVAQISINKKVNYIGLFNSEINAAIAYNKKALELFGEYAYLNEV